MNFISFRAFRKFNWPSMNGQTYEAYENVYTLTLSLHALLLYKGIVFISSSCQLVKKDFLSEEVLRQKNFLTLIKQQTPHLRSIGNKLLSTAAYTLLMVDIIVRKNIFN